MESLRCLSKEALILLHKNRTLLPLIKSELIQSKLAEVTLKDDLINKLEEQLINKLGLQKSEDYDSWLKENMLTKEQFKILATNDCRLKQYCHEQFAHKVESRFLDRKQELDIIIYSLIRVKDFFKARELYYRIIGKESDFGDLSTMYSEGIEQRTRGIVGPGPMARIHPKLAKHLKNSANGKVQSPIEIDGNHLITLCLTFVINIII
jgi:parvulin-like peptidyl-prolyl isomerase